MSAEARAYLDGLLVGRSPALQQVKELIIKAAPTGLAVMIEGETGTGKELVAEALHHLSGRPGRFVPVNVCAIPESMFDAELFGYAKGAFTGAVREHPGLLAEAAGGTLFLDEIGGLSLGSQAKLLRALEGQRYRGLGERFDRTSSFRLLAASNVPLLKLVRSGSFRPDLLFRLHGIAVQLSPLRTRGADIARLANHFARQIKHADGSELQIEAGALTRLEFHSWPGNVRELRSMIVSAAVLTPGSSIGRAAVEALLAANTTLPLDEVSERTRTIAAIKRAQGDSGHAADLLGVSRATLYRRAKRAGVRPGGFRVDVGTTDAHRVRDQFPSDGAL